MKSIFICLLMSCINILNAQYNVLEWTNFDKYKEQNKSVNTRPEVLFYGNSITEGWPKAMPLFFTDNNFIGRGIGGQVSAQLLLRFRQDVLALNPKKMILNIGINDIAENAGTYSEEFTVNNIESIIQLATANKIKVILASVLPVASFPWRKQLGDPSEKVIQLNDRLKVVARKNKIVYLDYHSALKDERNGLAKDMAPDDVHPNKACYEIMAKLALVAIKK
jgi:lysophospholipase L1-like esterase